jgi:acyl-CoA synthetase (AMP-forming)/AMP-acid ligase II
MAPGSQNKISNPMFEKTRNVSFALRRKLNPCFLGHLFEVRAHTRPDFPVLTFENPSGADIVQTFQDLHENSHRFAQALVDAGIEKGDTYAAIMHNYPEMVHLIGAASILGAVMAPIDPRTKGDKLAHQICNSKSKAVFITADLLKNMEAIKDKIPGVERIFTVEKPGNPPTGDVSKFSSIQEILEAPFRPVDYRVSDLNHPLQIIYTSGTTGDPKGVVFENLRMPVVGFLFSRYWDYRKGDILYTGLSLTHGNALGCTLTPEVYRCIMAVYCIFSVGYGAARFIVKKAGQRVRVDVNPHDLRRHAATFASRSGTPIEIVSKVILRHASLSTTQRYLGKVSDAEGLRWIETVYE